MTSLSRFPARLSFALLAMATLTAQASAHMGGQNFEKRDGNRLLDAGCIATEFIVDEETYCSFGYIDNPDSPDWTVVPYEMVTVTVRDEQNEPVFAGSAPGERETMTLLPVRFDKGGEFTMNVTFHTGTQVVASHEFAITVRKVEFAMQKRLLALAGAAVLAVIAAPVGYLAFRPSRKR